MSEQWKIKIRRRAKHGSTKGKLLSLSDPHQVTVYLTYIRTFHLAIYSDIPSGILSGIHSDIPSGILSGILIGMLSDIEFWHLACILTFGLAYVLTFYVNAAFYLPPILAFFLAPILTVSLACNHAQACSTASGARNRVQAQVTS